MAPPTKRGCEGLPQVTRRVLAQEQKGDREENRAEVKLRTNANSLRESSLWRDMMFCTTEDFIVGIITEDERAECGGSSQGLSQGGRTGP